MALVCIERKDSRTVKGGDSPSAELKYEIWNTAGTLVGIDSVFDQVAERSPATYTTPLDELYRVWPPDLEPNGRHWVATVQYLPDDQAVQPGSEEAPDITEIQFQVAGSSVHITQARATRASYNADGAMSTDARNVIGWDGKTVNGCDVIAPVLSFNLPWGAPLALVTWPWVRTVGGLVGKVNSATFLGFPAGEILFTGLTGARNSKMRRWDLTFSFLHSANVADLDVGGITVATKFGHDYLDVKFSPDEDGTGEKVVPKPVEAHVRKVYDAADLTALGFGGE